MSIHRRLVELGGVATYQQLVAVSPRAEVDAALRSGELVRLARGRYALRHVDEAVQAAHGLNGVLSYASAALGWGWAVKSVPTRPHVTVPLKRRVARRDHVQLHRRDLLVDEIVEGRTSQELTLEQCLRSMPFDEALAVADSALREGFSEARLRAIARDVGGPGAAALREVVQAADGRAANPFESVLRAICMRVPGLAVRPQVQIGSARVDLADEDQRIVLEADSFQWHGGRRELRRDAQRYNQLVVNGWCVLRFAWEDVMFCPDQVRATLQAAVVRAQGRR